MSRAPGSAEKMVRAIDRLIELDELESAKQHERVGFLALMDAVIEALPDGLVVTDANGNIILFNEKAEYMFGYHRSEMIGQKIEALLPERARALHVRHREMYNRFDAGPHARHMGVGLKITGIRSDGHEFAADITLARMVVPRGVFNLALVRYARRSEESEAPAMTARDPSPDFDHDGSNAGL
jgi:PAS domain S-box-containing protein